MQTDANRPPFWIPNETIVIHDLSNKEFLDRFARAGRIGLSTGSSFPDRVIARAQRHLNVQGQWGTWTHAFIFEGTRVDGNHWVVESDLVCHEKHVQLGVQENRLDRYYDEKLYPSVAVLDFGLSQEQTLNLVRESLDLVARRTRYSLRELVGIFLAMKNPVLRKKENVLAQDESFFCSAFVAHLLRKVGLNVVPGLTAKNTAPDDLARSPLPHTTYLLERSPAERRVVKVGKAIAEKVSAKMNRIRRATTLKRGRS
jgi:hypothetical protein